MAITAPRCVTFSITESAQYFTPGRACKIEGDDNLTTEKVELIMQKARQFIHSLKGRERKIIQAAYQQFVDFCGTHNARFYFCSDD